jgi:hypothetical protein
VNFHPRKKKDTNVISAGTGDRESIADKVIAIEKAFFGIHEDSNAKKDHRTDNTPCVVNGTSATAAKRLAYEATMNHSLSLVNRLSLAEPFGSQSHSSFPYTVQATIESTVERNISRNLNNSHQSAKHTHDLAHLKNHGTLTSLGGDDSAQVVPGINPYRPEPSSTIYEDFPPTIEETDYATRDQIISAPRKPVAAVQGGPPLNRYVASYQPYANDFVLADPHQHNRLPDAYMQQQQPQYPLSYQQGTMPNHGQMPYMGGQNCANNWMAPQTSNQWNSTSQVTSQVTPQPPGTITTHDHIHQPQPLPLRSSIILHDQDDLGQASTATMNNLYMPNAPPNTPSQDHKTSATEHGSPLLQESSDNQSDYAFEQQMSQFLLNNMHHTGRPQFGHNPMPSSNMARLCDTRPWEASMGEQTFNPPAGEGLVAEHAPAITSRRRDVQLTPTPQPRRAQRAHIVGDGPALKTSRCVNSKRNRMGGSHRFEKALPCACRYCEAKDRSVFIGTCNHGDLDTLEKRENLYTIMKQFGSIVQIQYKSAGRYVEVQ